MTQPRFNLYTIIHKALRAAMGETLAALGRMDPLDEADTTRVLGELRAVLALLRSHLEHENAFIHSALEARQPGASSHTAHDHEQHATALAALEAQVRRVAATQGALRAEAQQRLYATFALFVGENMEHMQVEESDNMQALWAAYSDDELVALHDALVASIAPEEMAQVLRWMVPSITPFERAALLGGIQAKAPAPVFSQILDNVRPLLTPREWDKLMHAIAPLPAAA
jgi:hemerythrin-like domain-containing protein